MSESDRRATLLNEKAQIEHELEVMRPRHGMDCLRPEGPHGQWDCGADCDFSTAYGMTMRLAEIDEELEIDGTLQQGVSNG